MTRSKATVVWELSEEEGRVLVDVDAPLRPFGKLPTPPKKDGTEPDGAPVSDEILFASVDDAPPSDGDA